MRQDPFFRPRPDWVGDIIPWTSSGQDDPEIRLHYLLQRDADTTQGMPWNLVTTSDLTHYVDRGQSLPSGGTGATDFNAYTGCVVTDDDGLHHLYYTAHNPEDHAPDGRPYQRVAHATSHDGLSWHKHPQDTFGAPNGYDPADWRDPYVYRLEGDPQWHMILAARFTEGAERRRGVVAHLVSEDLSHWDISEPLWDPGRFVTQECPELFQIGQWWYLVYSEFSDRFRTCYRYSRSPYGPWQAPKHDSLDGRGFYAAKSVSWKGRRLFFGWIARRAGASDDGAWLWAGTLACVEASQHTDGTLHFSIPQEVLATYSRTTYTTEHPRRLAAPTGYASTCLLPDAPTTYRLSADVTWRDGTREIALIFRMSADRENGYILRLEPFANRLVLDRWPRRVPGPEQWHIDGDIPHVIELERPVDLASGRAHLDLVLDGNLLQCCVNKEVMLSTSLYDHTDGGLGLSVLDGEATCALTLSTRP